MHSFEKTVHSAFLYLAFYIYPTTCDSNSIQFDPILSLSLSLFYDFFESRKEAVTDRRIEPRRINIEENMPKKCKQFEGEEQGWRGFVRTTVIPDPQGYYFPFLLVERTRR